MMKFSEPDEPKNLDNLINIVWNFTLIMALIWVITRF